MPTWSPVNIVTQLAIKGGNLPCAMLLPTTRVVSSGIEKDFCKFDKNAEWLLKAVLGHKAGCRGGLKRSQIFDVIKERMATSLADADTDQPQWRDTAGDSDGDGGGDGDDRDDPMAALMEIEPDTDKT